MSNNTVSCQGKPYHVQPGCHRCEHAKILFAQVEGMTPRRVCTKRRGQPAVVAAGICGFYKPKGKDHDSD
jgi:hypothetical protein